jgi:succinylarginine dihydrolase
MPKAFEINFDGIVGPTHHYGGLSLGNEASMKHGDLISSPKQAALEGLKKMKFLHGLGLKQAVLPPQERPDMAALKELGFFGTDEEILKKAYQKDAAILSRCSSAAAMWTANAATVSPSMDSSDGKFHLTTANLMGNFHRAREYEVTSRALKNIFSNEQFFIHHDALPAIEKFGDEGAANHTRFCVEYGEPGIEFFVYGKQASGQGDSPKKYPARQTLEASQAVAKQHGLPEERVLFAQQNPAMIDAGVFHNDVIAVGNQHVHFYHEKAFVDTSKVISELQVKFKALTGNDLCQVLVAENEVSVKEAVQTYLFNSQLVTLPDNSMALIAPIECEQNEAVRRKIESVLADVNNPIQVAHYLQVKQSMQNGGGPACLRLRVVLSEGELAAMNQAALFSDDLFQKLEAWIQKHYRDSLSIEDLQDVSLLNECQSALDELCQILKLGAIYPFQI